MYGILAPAGGNGGVHTQIDESIFAAEDHKHLERGDCSVGSCRRRSLKDSTLRCLIGREQSSHPSDAFDVDMPGQCYSLVLLGSQSVCSLKLSLGIEHTSWRFIIREAFRFAAQIIIQLREKREPETRRVARGRANGGRFGEVVKFVLS
jgi:hypothetical protein